ncbi:MAG TPA: ATPase, partial [Candidatus Dormibacteraeota bacterium]|nr:ATPase [Candidatus Dormibacteraeota bacterium]
MYGGSAEPKPEGSIEVIRGVAEAVAANVAKAITGKEAEIQLCLITLLCRGHLLIEDVPGVGKTTLAKALARSLDCS